MSHLGPKNSPDTKLIMQICSNIHEYSDQSQFKIQLVKTRCRDLFTSCFALESITKGGSLGRQARKLFLELKIKTLLKLRLFFIFYSHVFNVYAKK